MKLFYQIPRLLLLLIACCSANTLYGQIIDRQSFTQSSSYQFIQQTNLIQFDWQLDLGITAIALNQSPNHFYTAGFIQPNIYRHQQNKKPSHFDPNILIRYNEKAESIVLSSNESDLIIYGFQVFNFLGAKVFSNKTIISSSTLFLSTPITNLSSGIYFIQVNYLPENISSNFQFWIKTQKIIKK